MSDKPLDTSDIDGLSLRDSSLTILADKMSERAFDPQAKEMAREIIGKSDEEAKIPLLTLLDCCVYCAWCGGFEIRLLRILYEDAGGTEEEQKATLEDREIQRNKALGIGK